jgi:hypothetical protein
MAVDWSRVTVEHVRQACELYDSGAAVPKRPARSTFLVFQGKTYPAKFIRGLAYRLATGVELDPSRDYSGGEETVRFFATLGLTTRAEAAIGDPDAVRRHAEERPDAVLLLLHAPVRVVPFDSRGLVLGLGRPRRPGVSVRPLRQLVRSKVHWPRGLRGKR